MPDSPFREYYSKWSANEDYFVLLTDNAKAFDSIHHDYVLKVLAKQKFPPWFIETVQSLFSEVVVSSTLAPRSAIPIGRGVKQGCPLSPTLFVLIYDPLVRALKRVEALKPRAAADDLAVGSRSIESIVTEAIPRIDEFCCASGMGINRAKSVILCLRRATSEHVSEGKSSKGFWRTFALTHTHYHVW